MQSPSAKVLMVFNQHIKLAGTDEFNTNLYKCKLLAKKLGPHQVLVVCCHML